MDEPGGQPGGEPTFDDAWAAASKVREPSAEERVLRAELDRIRAQELGKLDRRAQRRRGRRRAVRWLGVLVALGVCAGIIHLHDRNSSDASATWTSGGGDLPGELATGDRPTPRPAADAPLGTPADPGASGGSFAYLGTQPGSDEPVAYDPCRPIAVVVSERSAPEGASDLLARAVATMSDLTGLAIEVEGTTTEQPRVDRDAYQPDRYGDRWAPVLVAWTDADAVPELAGDIAGIGGSSAVETPEGGRAYVSGIVLLDGPQIEEILGRPDGGTSAADVLLHELGHLLGLAHVSDPAELMYPEGQPDLHGLQRGDRTGLTHLGQGGCFTQL